MFTAFVAMIDDENTDLCVRGNGKTCSMVFYLYIFYKKNYEVWTNFYTTFSSRVIGFQQMIDDLKEIREDERLRNIPKEKRRKIIFGVTEMQDLINSVGSEKQQILYVDSFTSQMRKLDVDTLYDTQILKNINIRLRRHTEQQRIPFKFHLNGKQCNYDRCREKHIIKIFSYKPFIREPIRLIKAYEVGKLYNTEEIVIDRLVIPKDIPVKKINKKDDENGD